MPEQTKIIHTLLDYESFVYPFLSAAEKQKIAEIHERIINEINKK